MKRVISLAFFVFAYTIIAHSRPSSTHQRLADYIKVWGFLKYYHSALGTGRADADTLFLKYVDEVVQAKDMKAYHVLLRAILKELGPAGFQPVQPDTSVLFTRNDGTSWINTDMFLPADIRGQLQMLRRNGYTDSVHQYLPASFHATEIAGEKRYDNIQYPNIPYQLLALARYWNAIEYLFPYKYQIGKDWNGILLEQLPFFIEPMVPEVFERHLLQLNAAINDTHGGIVQVKQPAKVYGGYFPPFAFRFAGDSIVVTDLIDSTSCARQDIRCGDILISLRGRSIGQNIKETEGYISASNLSKKKDLLSSLGLLLPVRGFDSVVSVRWIRNGRVRDKRILLQRPTAVFTARLNLLYRLQTGNGTTTKNAFVLQSVDKDIAWVDAANLSILYNTTADDRAVDSVLQRMRTHTKAILLDLRCYATQAVFYNKFLAALGWELQPFCILKAHYRRFPGTYYIHDIFSPVNRPSVLPRYTGKIIVLVNEQTQSQSELIAMILQASGPASVVGAQSAGCDGDILTMPIPGGYTTRFSGRHVGYPDGTPSQQVGIRRDVMINYTTNGIASERDEILEAALRLVLK